MSVQSSGEVVLREVKNGEVQTIEKNNGGGYELITEYGGRRWVSEAYVNSRLRDAGSRPYGPRMVQGGLPSLGKKR
jgi:hypothetical protein